MPQKPCMHRGCPLKTSDKYCEYHVRLHQDDKPIISEKANPLCNTERNVNNDGDTKTADP